MTAWKDLKPGMFIIIRSSEKKRLGKPRYVDYYKDKAMASIVEVVNTHSVDGKVTQLFLKTLGTRQFGQAEFIKGKSANDLFTFVVKDPKDFFEGSKIRILK